MRARLAAARARQREAPPAAAGPARLAAVRLPADIPPADAQALLRLLGRAGGHQRGSRRARRSGKSKATAYEYLNMLREHGIAELVTGWPQQPLPARRAARAAAGARG